MFKTVLIICAFIIPALAKAQKEIPLYQGIIPGSIPCNIPEHSFIDTSWNKNGILIIEKVTTPTLTIYLPPKEKQNGTAVLICPGGGYSIIAAGHEGIDVAKAFNEIGVTAFVLKYRIPNDACMNNKMFMPLQDAQQAIYLIRKNAKEYGIDTSKLGIMGFSAGGHLASTAGTHFTSVRKEISGENLRPDFMILGYPVISFSDSIGHIGSRNNLIGKNADAKWIHYFSNEEQVTSNTPPTFLVHASDDDAVNPENSIRFYQALLKNKVVAELHLYQNGGHGFGLNNPTTNDKWFERCINWMKANKFIP